MIYTSTRQLVEDLDKRGELLRIKEEVDPYLQMAEIQRRIYGQSGPAVLFERVKDSPFPAVSNIFGTPERIRYIFQDSTEQVKRVINLFGDPNSVMKAPFKNLDLASVLFNALPKKVSPNSAPVLKNKTDLRALPGIVSWVDDGGRYITLPQVYTQHPDGSGPMRSNLGMYRVQLDGNDYKDNEIGLHYQIQRGISNHHQECLLRNKPLRVSIFIGGPPAMTVGAVMPLPDNMPEVTFAGMLGKRRFRYATVDGHVISAEADFCIVGKVQPGAVKPEGPFGDHLGYYSLTHDMPVIEVEAVYHRDDAIWPFTVVGRPPQEDTEFGDFIHELTDKAVGSQVAGLKEVHAVDQAGVHPLLLAIGRDHYMPFMERSRPAQLLTVASGVLGAGQLSLAKYLFIAAEEDKPTLTTKNVPLFFRHVLERVDLTRDVHYYTNNTIDTLDYSGDGLNRGSKVIFAAAGEPIRKLSSNAPDNLPLPEGFSKARIAMDGTLLIQGPPFDKQEKGMEILAKKLEGVSDLDGLPLIVVVDDSDFVSKDIDNFLWVTFTRSNPAADIYGIESFYKEKHWGCNGSLIVDARIKPHHAPPLIEDEAVNKKVDILLASLE